MRIRTLRSKMIRLITIVTFSRESIHSIQVFLRFIVLSDRNLCRLTRRWCSRNTKNISFNVDIFVFRNIHYHVVQTHDRIYLILIENVVSNIKLKIIFVSFLDRELDNVLANVLVHRRKFAVVIDNFVVRIDLNDFVVNFEKFLLSIVFVSTNEKERFEFESFVVTSMSDK